MRRKSYNKDTPPTTTTQLGLIYDMLSYHRPQRERSLNYKEILLMDITDRLQHSKIHDVSN